MITIRNYTPEDYTGVYRLYKQQPHGAHDLRLDTLEALTKKITADPQSIIVVDDATEIVGTLSFMGDLRFAMIYRFYVDERKDKQPIAQKLYSYAEKILKDRGYDEVQLFSDEDNVGEHVRYHKIGFQTRAANYNLFWKDIA